MVLHDLFQVLLSFLREEIHHVSEAEVHPGVISGDKESHSLVFSEFLVQVGMVHGEQKGRELGRKERQGLAHVGLK